MKRQIEPASSPTGPFALYFFCLLLCTWALPEARRVALASTGPNAASDANSPELHTASAGAALSAPNNLSPGAPAEPNLQETPTSSDSIVPMSTAPPLSGLGSELWRERITIPTREQENRARDDLLRMIRLVRAIEIKKPSISPEPQKKIQPASPGEPNKPAAKPQKASPPARKERAATGESRPQRTISPETLDIVRAHLQQPEQMPAPLELADILFLGNCPNEAAVCYQQALDRQDPNRPGPDTDWILLQIGNCLKQTDPNRAIQSYARLIREYPNSPWLDLAKASSKLTEWYELERPLELITQSKPTPAAPAEPASPEALLTESSKTEQQEGG